MSGEQNHNGWANYPTWCVNLWLSNDEGLYHATTELVAATVAEPPHTSEYWNSAETARYNVADALEEFVTSDIDDGGLMPTLDGFPSDLLGYALGEVNWHELADAWIESAAEASA
jgi:hypothetical protein